MLEPGVRGLFLLPRDQDGDGAAERVEQHEVVLFPFRTVPPEVEETARRLSDQVGLQYTPLPGLLLDARTGQDLTLEAFRQTLPCSDVRPVDVGFVGAQQAHWPAVRECPGPG